MVIREGGKVEMDEEVQREDESIAVARRGQSLRIKVGPQGMIKQNITTTACTRF